MKVKIAYSVDVDSVPDKVVEILQKNTSLMDEVYKSADDCCTLVNMSVSPEKYKLALELIHSMRTKLAMFDQILSDTSMVLDGFHRMLTEPPPAGTQTEEKVKEMQEKLSQMQGESTNVD